MAKLEMVDNFLKSEAVIKEVVQAKKPALLADVVKIYSECKPIFEDYQKMLTPIKARIRKLEGDKHVTISQYLPLFLTLRRHWLKLSLSQQSSSVLKSLCLAGIEVLDKKMNGLNKEIIYPAAYLDPMMRAQIVALEESSGITDGMVSWAFV